MQIYHFIQQHSCVVQVVMFPSGIHYEVHPAYELCPALGQHGLLPLHPLVPDVG